MEKERIKELFCSITSDLNELLLCMDRMIQEDDETIDSLESIEDRKIACEALKTMFAKEEIAFGFAENPDGSGVFHIRSCNSYEMELIDYGHAEFRWYSEPFLSKGELSLLEQITELKSRITLRKADNQNHQLCVEYTLLSNQEDPKEFSANILLNMVYFQADINAIFKKIKTNSI